MTDKKLAEAVNNAVELSEDSLDEASGGAVFIKFDGVDGESVKTSHEATLKTSQFSKF